MREVRQGCETPTLPGRNSSNGSSSPAIGCPRAMRPSWVRFLDRTTAISSRNINSRSTVGTMAASACASAPSAAAITVVGVVCEDVATTNSSRAKVGSPIPASLNTHDAAG
ncbi:hypothetical protein VaNZ11_005237, partial [Volvox africanus]